jgi:hypothetical protein
MSVDVKVLIEEAPATRSVLKAIIETPYIEHQALAGAADLSSEELDAAMAALTENMVILELASQADSSVESRVPKKVYLINPELEQAVRDAL